MFTESVFVPLLHDQTPSIQSFGNSKANTAFDKYDLVPKINDVKSVAYLRQKLSEAVAYQK